MKLKKCIVYLYLLVLYQNQKMPYTDVTEPLQQCTTWHAELNVMYDGIRINMRLKYIFNHISNVRFWIKIKYYNIFAIMSNIPRRRTKMFSLNGIFLSLIIFIQYMEANNILTKQHKLWLVHRLFRLANGIFIKILFSSSAIYSLSINSISFN